MGSPADRCWPSITGVHTWQDFRVAKVSANISPARLPRPAATGCGRFRWLLLNLTKDAGLPRSMLFVPRPPVPQSVVMLFCV